MKDQNTKRVFAVVDTGAFSKPDTFWLETTHSNPGTVLAVIQNKALFGETEVEDYEIEEAEEAAVVMGAGAYALFEEVLIAYAPTKEEAALVYLEARVAT